ncbi:MAG: SidA/IucD/PvdA family monooxygenase [Gemmatimonadetes bacterium]|nr:SidA/IucD/PvdA family monooxygenase [Gemmatimonadota bacterium]MYB69919.1 SidA/IucD/PvdA family monooxygenase [Gemmatimonadota bacterium]
MNPEHHTVIIVGGGPAGLPLAVVLGGWHPFFRNSRMFAARYAPLARYLQQFDRTARLSSPKSLLGLDMQYLVQSGIRPVDLFRTLHHPRQLFEELDQVAMDFRRGEPLDALLISREPVGGLWNRAPHNLLTLSPGQWMEFAFYPLAQHATEIGHSLDVNALILKTDLIDYYHRVPERFGVAERIRTFEEVERIEPHERGFQLTSRHVQKGTEQRYTCKYLVLATGQRAQLRSLGVEGEEWPFVTAHYDKPADFPGERVLVVGGGRSGDWAATELHDAGKQVYYAMRQGSAVHWQLINDSRHGLPYYHRIAEILESRSPRLKTLYHTHVTQIAEDGQVELKTPEGNQVVEVDHVIKEIGGTADYSILQGFTPLTLAPMRDNYRFQLDQVQTHAHNYESIDIPNLYLGGYLAAGIGLVVIAMHGTTYAIAGDILQKEGRLL